MTAAVHCLQEAEQPQPPRSQQISTWLFNVSFSISILKHLVTAVYLAAQILIFALTDTAQRRAARVYAINSVIVIYALLLALHLDSPIKSTNCETKSSWLDLDATAPTVELVCQSYEAFQLASLLVDHNLVIFYVILVALHVVVLSSFLCLKQSTLAHHLLLGWTSSLLSFCLHALFTLQPESRLECSTYPLLYIHYNFVTSLENLVAKTVIQLSSIVASWRHVANLELSSRCQGQLPSAAASMHMKNKRLLKLYWICSVGWALVLLGSLIGAFKPTCPPVCATRASPLWSRKCHCTYAHVNCHTLGFLGDSDVDSLLRADELGCGLLVLQVSRCDLSKGLTTATLNQFQSLFFLAIKFTKYLDMGCNLAIFS
ncbi:hypothetical protein Ae201684_016576 [Aphanomyces euteiches]|uniref:Uncharacterized protein n=1 Tax=Aphanomyces euteiches TaxID=100861 RepID=A0A6G0WEP6_9STRA|nr:hypothetical protein Ae201684_016576 [Aphanomyces euteiches]KAH9144507.1 hypothetical protein AeRB84_011560 [Aphanomyces euteiches]